MVIYSVCVICHGITVLGIEYQRRYVSSEFDYVSYPESRYLAAVVEYSPRLAFVFYPAYLYVFYVYLYLPAVCFYLPVGTAFAQYVYTCGYQRIVHINFVTLCPIETQRSYPHRKTKSKKHCYKFASCSLHLLNAYRAYQKYYRTRYARNNKRTVKVRYRTYA